MIGYVSFIIAALSLSGCGTCYTVFEVDSAVRSRLERVDTKCDAIPWIYSGLAYNFSHLHAKPRTVSVREEDGPLAVVDGVITVAADIVVLPITLVQPCTKGSIKLY